MIQVAIIFLLFAFIHSVTVSTRFKYACRKQFNDTFMRVYYRALYNVIGLVTFAIAVYLIAQVPDREIWTAPYRLQWAMHGVQLAGLAFGVLSFKHLDTGEFMGFTQIRRFLAYHEVAGNIEGISEKALVTTGVYGVVRHPLYLAGIIIVAFNPAITVNGLTFTVSAAIYFLFGVFIEERRFLALYGEEYRKYRGHVPRLIPRILPRRG